MKNAGERAAELNLKGYNCAQSVFATFAGECGLDFDDAIKIASPFGGGIAQMRGVCGAFAGLCMAIGAKYGPSEPATAEQKEALYKMIHTLEQQFCSRWATTNCKEILANAEREGQERPCREIMKETAAMVGEWMLAHDTI